MVALLQERGITSPTPIQQKIIPAIFEGRDVIAQSETGSGKTLSFAIPMIERMNRRDGLKALVICPTRELAVQIAAEFIKFSHGKHIGITPIYGGVSLSAQAKRLSRTNIIVGTPGRLIDLMNRGLLDLSSIKTLVLDEADRMLDMGFIKDIEKIIHKISKERQTLMFSATLAKEIVTLSKKYLQNPVHVQMASSVKPELLHQTYFQTTPDQKLHLLIHLLKSERDLALVFCNRKHITAKIAKQLGRSGVHARCLNGDMSQGQRERTTADFRNKKFNVLVATDVAARGLHIDDITHVYNYEIPRDVESYTHRVGRTARAGEKGEAISLVTNGEERSFFQRILFTYKGGIQLKGANDVGFVKVNSADQPVEAMFKPKFPARSAGKGVGGSYRSRRPSTHHKGDSLEHSIDKHHPKKHRTPVAAASEGTSERSVNARKRNTSSHRSQGETGVQPEAKRRVWDKRSFGEMLHRKKKGVYRSK